MPDEKYHGYCSECADNPPFFEDDKISDNLLYNPWCLFCDCKKDNGEPRLFWSKGKHIWPFFGHYRFFYKCERIVTKHIGPIKIRKRCGWKASKNIDRSMDFDAAFVNHYFAKHGMYISDAQKETLDMLRREVISKYLLPDSKK